VLRGLQCVGRRNCGRGPIRGPSRRLTQRPRAVRRRKCRAVNGGRSLWRPEMNVAVRVPLPAFLHGRGLRQPTATRRSPSNPDGDRILIPSPGLACSERSSPRRVRCQRRMIGSSEHEVQGSKG
jgi:hypothetical protein